MISVPLDIRYNDTIKTIESYKIPFYSVKRLIWLMIINANSYSQTKETRKSLLYRMINSEYAINMEIDDTQDDIDGFIGHINSGSCPNINELKETVALYKNHIAEMKKLKVYIKNNKKVQKHQVLIESI